MFSRRTVAATVALTAAVVLPLLAQRAVSDAPDLDAFYRIKDAGISRSQVMELTSYLTDVYGPRLTGSPNIKEAADWAQKTMNGWGLSNVHLETFPFGRGWQNDRFVALALTPRAYPLFGYPKAWTPGTKGAITGEAVMAIIQTEADFDKYKGKLRGKFVLTVPERTLNARFEPLGRRYTDADLSALASQPTVGRGRGNAAASPATGPNFARRRTQFWIDEGVAAVIDTSNGDGGTLFVQSGGSRNPSDPPVPAQVTLAAEHYGRIARTLEKNVPVTLQMDIANRFLDADPNAFNIIAELPGTDKADEVVMIGAHFDSWHTATGATDNAAGSAVMMEAMRILKTSGVRLRRTVRIALWGGEEQGLLGSREYVKAHFGDPATMQLKPEHAKLSAYYNVDNGTGLIRGVYQQGNEAVAPVFQTWMEPLRNLGMTTLTIRNTGGTDHQAFDAVGLPGFQFIQDPIEYDSRTHHSNMDFYERIQANDMIRNAVIVAAFVYNTANRDSLLPRKPLPRPPSPAGRSGQ
ncbi:MAG TPA: M20/M25/M40 family metallo-hydrolase [Vicinamibacterales bacterium]|nr:M20/M25/M40 family metallo-hydrolase [Vicinamibacterales bacterium]